jgi:hypothetical protein
MGFLSEGICESLDRVKYPKHIFSGGKRYHQTPYGLSVGVTTILGQTNESKEFLDNWRKNNPDLSKQYLERGNLLHSDIEKYFIGVDDNFKSPLFPQINSFLNELTPLLVEYPLYSKWGFAGSIDFVGKYKNENILCDWKTTTNRKTKSKCKDYFLQLSAYDQLLQERLNVKVDKGCIVLAQEGTKEPTIYWLSRKELDDLFIKFLERLELYNSMFDTSF